MAQTNWNSDLYNQKHDFVTQYGIDVIELLNPQFNEIILDLGCGSGELTKQIAEKCNQASGCDYAASMIAKARHNFPEITFMQHNAELEFPIEAEKFDAVFSNAALHWMLNPEKVIQNIYRVLKSGGRFVFEMGGKGNVHKVLQSIQSAADDFNLGKLPLINYYPSIAEYSTLLEKNGFQVTFATLFDRPTLLQGEHGLANWVTMFRHSVLDQLHINQHENFLNLVERYGYDTLYDNHQWIADYVRLRMVAYKIG